MLESEACFDDETMMQIEKSFVEKWGITRRNALGILKNPGRKLHDIFQTDREHADEMVASYDNLSEYTKMLREFADLMEKALAWMMLSYCSMEDMEEVMEEGRSDDDDEEKETNNGK
jgi:hypothetical protein